MTSCIYFYFTNLATDPSFVESSCSSSSSCFSLTGCSECTSSNCLWCPSIGQCVPNYPLTYPYAQCLGWINSPPTCPPDECEGHTNCSECQSNSRCGWCNDPLDTGLGQCLDGGFTSPRQNGSCNQVDNFGQTETWNFDICPGIVCVFVCDSIYVYNALSNSTCTMSLLHVCVHTLYASCLYTLYACIHYTYTCVHSTHLEQHIFRVLVKTFIVSTPPLSLSLSSLPV